MANFFRKIRKQLADDNPPDGRAGRPLKYMRYAFGEIVLVVIGILIALQINNWNQDRKTNQLETKLLKEVLNSLTVDSLNIMDNIRQNQTNYEYASLIDSVVINDLPYHDSLSKYLSRMTLSSDLRIDYTSFESLSNVGLIIIRNDAVRKKIVGYYQECRYISDVQNKFFVAGFFRNNIYPRYFKGFGWADYQKTVPVNFTALKKASDFNVGLGMIINDSKYYKSRFETLLKHRNEVEQQINSYLKKQR